MPSTTVAYMCDYGKILLIVKWSSHDADLFLRLDTWNSSIKIRTLVDHKPSADHVTEATALMTTHRLYFFLSIYFFFIDRRFVTAGGMPLWPCVLAFTDARTGTHGSGEEELTCHRTDTTDVNASPDRVVPRFTTFACH